MTKGEVIAIDLDDGAFKEFQRKFTQYEELLKTLPAYWAASTKEVTAQKTQFEKIRAEVEASTVASAGIEKSQAGVSKIATETAISFGLLSTHGKHFAADIHRSTQSLMKWTKLTSVFSGIIGAGGLFGINRMASSAAGQRTSATGLGVSYGEQSSFLTSFGRLGNAEGILGGFSQGLATPVGKAQIAHLLGHQPTGDAAETAAEALPKFKEFVDKTPDAMLGKMLDAFGYSKLGLGVEQAKVIRGMSSEEVARLSRSYRGNKTGLGLDDKTAKKWTDFSTQMERASWELENVFAKGLVKLTPGLEHLSDSFVHLVDNFLKDGSPIKGWIDSFGKGLGKFEEAIESRSFMDGADRIARDTTALIHVVERLTSLSLKDVFAGMASGMDASRSDIEQRYGKNWFMHPGRLRLTSPDSYKPGGGEPTRHQSGADGSAAAPGTPWNHQLPASDGTPLGDAMHHPARYQGTLSVDGQTFDYASGSYNRGRGSSPFGDHPITNFDPRALQGRGGGAFRTKDVYDPQVRDVRGAVEIHMSTQDDVTRVETAGCYGIPRSEWPAAKAAISKFMANHPEGATLRVHPDGRAEIVSRNDKSSAAGPAREPVSRGIQGKNPADIAEKMLGLHDRNPKERALLRKYLDTGGHGMDPAEVNWCASFVSATLHHAGLSDIPAAQGGDVALSYMNWGTAVSPEDVRRGDIMIGGTQGHKRGEQGGHVAIVTGPEKGGRIPIVEGDQRDDVSSYMTSPGSVYSKVKFGKEYHGGHNVNANTVGSRDEGLMFRRPPAVGMHPADLTKGAPTGVDVNNETGSSTSVDVSH